MSGRFKQVSPTAVQGDGFTVKKEGTFQLRYTDRGGRSILVDTELYVDPNGTPGFLVHPEGARRWLPPHASEPIDRDLQAQILQQICEAVQALGSHARCVHPQKFARPKPNIVESSRGYRVTIASSKQIIYERGGRSMQIDATKDVDQTGQPRVVLQVFSVSWIGPNDPPPPSTTELASAIQNVVDAFAALGVRKLVLRK